MENRFDQCAESLKRSEGELNDKMKKIFFCVAGLALLAALGVSGWMIHPSGKESVSTETGPRPLTLEEKTDKVVSQMTASQKIGQLMMIGIGGPELDADARYMLTEFPNGNVILFDRNMKKPEQVKKLNDDITTTVIPQTGLKPFIAVDQEGGAVMRMSDYLPAMPSAETLGQGTPDGAKSWAVTTGQALTDLGFNLNFAPVVDLNAAYHRSYGKTPEQVIPYAEAVIQGYDKAGIKSCLKHFPGIGKVKTDPHMDGDVVDISRAALDREDGKPYIELIKKTNPDTTFVMVSNVTFPQLDAANPACISPAVMTNILRKDYGYKGLIFTDDMEMGAMAKHYSFSEMGVKAIQAGADIILVCHDYGHEQEVFNGLLKAYRDGTLPKNMIDFKVRKIVKVKLQLADEN